MINQGLEPFLSEALSCTPPYSFNMNSKRDLGYSVLRYTRETDGGDSDTEVCGTYATLEKANQAARDDLLAEGPKDSYLGWDEELTDGMLSIEAETRSRAQRRVFVERRTFFGAASALATKSKKPKSPAKAASVPLSQIPKVIPPKTVWVILQTEYENADDKRGRSQFVSRDGWDTVAAANEAAWDLVLEACGAEEEDGDEEALKGRVVDRNRGSTVKEYRGTVSTPNDEERHSVRIEVQKINIHCSSELSSSQQQRAAGASLRSKRGSSPTPIATGKIKKKPRQFDQVIVISD